MSPTQHHRQKTFSLPNFIHTYVRAHTHGYTLTVLGEAGGCDEALAERLLSLIRYGPVISKDSTFQLIQVGGGKLHASP